MKKDDMTKRRKKTKSKTMTMINTFREHLQNFKTFREQPPMAILEKLWNCWHFWQWTAFAILAMFTLGMLVRESDELKTSASWIELKLSTRVWWLKTSSIKDIYIKFSIPNIYSLMECWSESKIFTPKMIIWQRSWYIYLQWQGLRSYNTLCSKAFTCF